jgi:excinuclease ABC subunit A
VDKIIIRGARTHNLKGISTEIPRDKLVVITGLSGSGKSSLAFDTLYAEGQRRYVESLSAYARQFLSVMEKPDVEHIEGLSPAISIEQKSTSHNPRSTVGTITEIYDYLRLLFARAGIPRCPEHHRPLIAQTVTQMVDQTMELDASRRYMLLAPVVKDKKGEYQQLFESLKTQGFIRARVDGEVLELDEIPVLAKTKKHSIDVVIDRFKIKEGLETRLAESFETALKLADGTAVVMDIDDNATHIIFSSRYACPLCNYSLQELEPRLFSFNSPSGACTECDGLGITQHIDEDAVIADGKLSLEEGAIKGWDKRNFYYHHMLMSLARHYKFDIKTPFAKLPKKVRHSILYGSGNENVNFRYANERGDIVSRVHAFEGVIPNFERRYKETDSESVREDLAKLMTETDCPACKGSRLNSAARHVFVGDHSMQDIVKMSIIDAHHYFCSMRLEGYRQKVAEKILKEIIERLHFLVNVGLNYLTLNRRAETLSGGEAQRIRLASQIGAGLVGVMYILDEPSIGLHQRDNERLLESLVRLRDLGNSVLVVEHDEDAIRSADHIIDIGPAAGKHGGEIVAQGSLQDILSCDRSLTGRYLSGALEIAIPAKRHEPDWKRCISVNGATGNNLKSVSVKLPLGLLTCVTGVSGSGKSTLINETLYKISAQLLNGASEKPAPYTSHTGFEHLESVIDIDQSPIGRTPRSNPATYTGLFGPIRELFANTPEARSRGYTPGRFSFNVRGGRCEACEGDGVIRVAMHFLPDMYVNCDICNGKRYNRETLDIRYKGKTISEVLELPVEDALNFFENIPAINRKLRTLLDVGLGYIQLGQSATTLSGGEAQRIKLSKELSKRDTGKTLYILDEPTTGLHFHDINQLLGVLHRLRDRGNTLVIIEHNLDVIKTADWIVDMGPEGGAGGGTVIATGTPEAIAEDPNSHTGKFLKAQLAKQSTNGATLRRRKK